MFTYINDGCRVPQLPGVNLPLRPVCRLTAGLVWLG